MKARFRFLVAVAVLGLLMTGPFTLTGALLMADLQGAERQALIDLLVPHMPLGALMTVIGFILGLQVLSALFKQYVQGLLGMAEHLRLMMGANRSLRINPEGPPEVRELALAVNHIAQQRDDLMRDVEQQITQAKTSLEEEKNRLAALMSELAMAVVVCNLDGRILLYNSRARLQFKALAQGPTSMSGGALIGLGRSIFSILERAQITHALEKIQQRLKKTGSESGSNFITSTRTGQLLRVQMAPVLRTGADGALDGPHPPGEGGDGIDRASPAREKGGEPLITGYVLTIENVTRSFERETHRDQALQTLTSGNRAALGAVRAAVETLVDSPDMETGLRERFIGIIGEESARMTAQLEITMSEFADSLKTRWPLEDMLGIDLVAAVQRRIEGRLKLLTKSEELDDTLWIRVDSFSLIQAITFLAAQLSLHYEIRELRFRLSAEGKMAFFDLIWSGPPVSSETLYTWELESMVAAGETSPLTLRDVIDRHGGEIWYQREKAAHRAFFRIVLPVAMMPDWQPEQQAQHLRGESRPEYYDFDLFAARDASIDLDRRLVDLAYSVFDTETTGLEPSAGDEIIQIGAVRAINGRLLRQEIFDQLIDPRIPLKPAGIPIHGITEDMVRGQPTIDLVLPAFHEFCSETVLVAHNAAFDMRFLQLKEASLGVSFSQPVLDTLLLSAVIHPNQELHRLEAIAERLGIHVIGRHTALGDAFVTGDVFLKMIPLLADMGIVTLRQALEAAEKTYYARVKY